jgi:two-component system response regulator HydG
MREGIARVVEKMGAVPIVATDAPQALQALAKSDFDVVVTDYKLPGGDGLTILRQVKERRPECEVMVITAYGTIELAVEAMQAGAADFITKPFSPEELRVKLEKLFERLWERRELRRLSEENLYLREEMEDRFHFGEIIGRSAPMQAVFRTIEKVAPQDSTVIIYGESGTGKELVARAVHRASPRRDGPFVRVNCGALTESLLESELFGHERGAFTGAVKRKKGRFELAHRGTIFLDEIGDISHALQVKLLRVLQEREFERVGGEETVSVDVRVIAATHKELRAEVAAGHFRDDLYYRLHIIPIYLPPLRQRREDIPVLVEHFISRLAVELRKPNLRIAPEAVEQLQNYDWPGNIRELENVLERAAVLCEGDTITALDLPVLGRTGGRVVELPNQEYNLNEVLESVERQLIERALAHANGVKAEAARLLGIKSSALYYKLEKYGLL